MILLTAQVAERLQVSTKTVLEMARRGELPATKIGREWRFDETTLAEWMQMRTRANLRSPLPLVIPQPRVSKPPCSLAESLNRQLAQERRKAVEK